MQKSTIWDPWHFHGEVDQLEFLVRIPVCSAKACLECCGLEACFLFGHMDQIFLAVVFHALVASGSIYHHVAQRILQLGLVLGFSVYDLRF